MGDTEKWSTEICDECCGARCLTACIFPCLQFGENIDMMEKEKVPMPDIDMISFNGAIPRSSCGCLVYAIGCLSPSINAGVDAACFSVFFNLLEFFPIFLHMRLRTSLREKYKIKTTCCCEGQCDDFCCATFCYSCALAQEYIELTERKKISAQDVNKKTAQTLMPTIENSFLIPGT
jgi:Cys-rich protein (TIGR01571 family)